MSLRWEYLQPSKLGPKGYENLAAELLKRKRGLVYSFPLDVKTFCAEHGVAVRYDYVLKRTVRGSQDFLKDGTAFPVLHVNAQNKATIFLPPLLETDANGQTVLRSPENYDVFTMGMAIHTKMHLPISADGTPAKGPYFVWPGISTTCASEALAVVGPILMPANLVREMETAPIPEIARKFGVPNWFASMRTYELRFQR